MHGANKHPHITESRKTEIYDYTMKHESCNSKLQNMTPLIPGSLRVGLRF